MAERPLIFISWPPFETYSDILRVYIAERTRKPMKPFQKIFFSAFVGLLAVSCTTLGAEYEYSSWNAEQYEEGGLTYKIDLNFFGSQVCTISEGLLEAGDDWRISVNRYEVKWSSGNSFTLHRIAEGNTSKQFSGSISGDELSLNGYRIDGAELSIKLKKTRYICLK